MQTAFDGLAERCRQALTGKYRQGRQHQAGPLLESELQLIQQQGCHDGFLEAEKVVRECRQRGAVCRLVGSGCSSLVSYLLGLSDVDPVKFRLHYQRFYSTADGLPPKFQLCTAHTDEFDPNTDFDPALIALRPMTRLERIAWLTTVEGEAESSLHDPSVYSALWHEDAQAIFQFEHPDVRHFAAILQPKRIREVATVTALHHIEVTEPKVVARFLRQRTGRQRVPEDQGRFIARGPLLFQEQVMGFLRLWAGMPWNDSYEFVRAAASHRLDQSGVTAAVKAGLRQKASSEDEAADRFLTLQSTATYAVCLAHHVANATTSYRAAYLFRRHPDRFKAAANEPLPVEALTP